VSTNRERAKELIARGRETTETARRWAERTIFWQVWERMLENEFIDRSVALASKAFVSFFPTVIVIAAFSPASVRESIYETIARRTGLEGAGLETFRTAFRSSDDIRRATGLLGLLFTFFYINSFTTALSRVYMKAWRRPKPRRVSAYAIGVTWLVGVMVYFALIGAARSILGNGPETAAFALVALIGVVGLWWLTPWLMLQRQVRLRVLATTAIITGVAQAFYGASASIWMPRTLDNNQEQFGFFGVALTLVTWLSGAAIIIVIGACAGPVVAEDRGILGRLVRGTGRDDVLAPGAPPSLPAPLRPAGLADAIGLGAATRDQET
jgi:membrane protein